MSRAVLQTFEEYQKAMSFRSSSFFFFKSGFGCVFCVFPVFFVGFCGVSHGFSRSFWFSLFFCHGEITLDVLEGLG